jgi:cytochrome bd-type quinol oxidase subunit 1
MGGVVTQKTQDHPINARAVRSSIRSQMLLYIILAVVFIALLFAYVRTRGRRLHG